MHARSMSGREEWTQVENMIPFVRQHMHPAISAIPGNLGVCLLLDQHGRRYVIVSGWETLEGMHSSESVIAPMRAEAARTFHGTADVEEWDVVGLDRAAALEPGCWVSVACADADAATLERVAGAVPPAVVPTARNLSGYVAAVLLRSRRGGRVAHAVVFDSYPSLHSARKANAPIHDLSSAGLVVRDDAVVDYEMDIADMSLPHTV